MPRTEVKVKILFTIGELKEQFLRAYEQAIKDNSDWNVDSEHWCDFDGMLDFSTEEETTIKRICFKRGMRPLEIQNGLRSKKGSCLFHYKLSAFDIDRNSHIKFEEVNMSKETERLLMAWFDVPIEYLDNCRLNLCSDRGRYPDSYFELDWFNWDISEPEDFDDLVESVKDESKQFFGRGLSCLSKSYDYLTSEEAIFESLESNEYEFELVDPTDSDSDLANRRRTW